MEAGLVVEVCQRRVPSSCMRATNACTTFWPPTYVEEKTLVSIAPPRLMLPPKLPAAHNPPAASTRNVRMAGEVFPPRHWPFLTQVKVPFAPTRAQKTSEALALLTMKPPTDAVPKKVPARQTPPAPSAANAVPVTDPADLSHANVPLVSHFAIHAPPLVRVMPPNVTAPEPPPNRKIFVPSVATSLTLELTPLPRRTQSALPSESSFTRNGP